MWRFLGLVLMAIAVACGGGDGDDQQVSQCNLETAVLPPTSPALISVSLEEAREIAGFEVFLPQDLPADVAVEGPAILRSQLCPENIFGVQIAFRGPDYAILLTEQGSGNWSPPTGGSPIRINGVAGVVERHMGADGPVVIFSWSDGERVYGGAAQLTGALTEQVFLQILESIPE